MPTLSGATAISRIGFEHEPRTLTFQGGVNNSLPDEDIGETEVSDSRNWLPDFESAAGLIKREGTTTTSSNIDDAYGVGTSVFQGKHANYFTTGIAATQYVWNFAGTALANNAVTSSGEPDWVTFNNNDIYTLDGGAPQTSTNGSTFAALGGTPPNFRYMRAHNNFLFGAGHSLGLLRWADLGTATTWTSTNSLTITNDEANSITGLAKFRNNLVVFCRYSFHNVNGFSGLDMGINYNSYGIGCTSHRSIVVTPFALFWWSDNGLVMSRTGTEDDITFPLYDKIPVTLNGLNKARYANVHGVWNSRKDRVEYYVCSGAAQTTQNMRIDYYYKTGAVWLHDGGGVAAGASGAAVVSGSRDIYVFPSVTDATAGAYLYLQDEDALTDNTININAFLETRRDAPISRKALKRFRTLTVNAASSGNSTLDYGVYLDSDGTLTDTWSISLTGSTGFILDTDTLDSGILGTGIVPSDSYVGSDLRYRKVKHRIYDSSAQRTRLRSLINSGYLLST